MSEVCHSHPQPNVPSPLEDEGETSTKSVPTLNTSGFPPGKGKMQKRYKHKTLSLGTWPTEGHGFELAIDAWRTFMQEFTPLKAADVAADDDRLKELVAAAQRAAKRVRLDPACILPYHCHCRSLLGQVQPDELNAMHNTSEVRSPLSNYHMQPASFKPPMKPCAQQRLPQPRDTCPLRPAC